MWITRRIRIDGSDTVNTAPKEATNLEYIDISIPKPRAGELNSFYTIILD